VTMEEREHDRPDQPDQPDRRESAEAPEHEREREAEPRGVEDPATHPEPPASSTDEEDERVDREAAETFPASDPPANY
jgi:hypothetical protein